MYRHGHNKDQHTLPHTGRPLCLESETCSCSCFFAVGTLNNLVLKHSYLNVFTHVTSLGERPDLLFDNGDSDNDLDSEDQ